ncbi:MAG TPA: M20/M25/M40 family metallo-hydrolase [Pirellulaceae bacterium]|nr:M20/M25/M40 family metallo-hydrolase [Pirellulaceae bacterium]
MSEPNVARALELVTQLMAIPGKSGEESGVAKVIIERLTAAGAPEDGLRFDDANTRTQLKGDVGNLILQLPGTKRAPRRMLSAHMDTVPICIGARPRKEGEFLRSANPKTGLGADDRAGCAVVLAAALEILENKLPHPPLTFCWFIQEEIGLHGARHLDVKQLGKPKLAFNFDGGSPAKLTIGATGGYRMQIVVSGLASHAGVSPELGVSAISIASLAIADLQRDGWLGLVEKGKKRGTSNVGYIHGGEATNVVTDRVELKAECRSHDPKFREKIQAEIEKAFTRAAKELQNSLGQRGSVQFNGRLDYEAFRLEDDSACVVAAEAAVQAVGREPLRAISNGGLDSNWLFQHGIPSVTLGCGQVNPHMVTEALDIAQFEDAVRIGLRLATAS